MDRRPDAPFDTDRNRTDAVPSWTAFVSGLRAFVASRVPAQDADDVAQDVFVRLHQGAASLRDQERLESWVFGIARRAIADYYRKRRPQDTAADAELPDPRTPETAGFGRCDAERSPHEEVLSWLRPMAEELSERYRSALIATDFEGKPQRQLAAEAGISISGAKSRVQRARALLGKALERCCAVELGPEGRVVDFERRDCDC